MVADIKRYQDRISIYEKTLGLSIKRTKQNGNLQVTLRGCCAEDVDLPCCLTLRSRDGGPQSDELEVVKCNPPIADIQRLLDLFNQTGDFRSFLLVLRRRFVRYFELRKVVASSGPKK